MGATVKASLAFFILAGSSVATGHVAGQSYPTKPIRLIVPVAPGGATDVVSRVVASPLTIALGQQVVVDNRTGAAGTIGLDAAAKAAPDGYTLVAYTDSIAILPSIYQKLSFDPQTSFTPIILMTTQPLVLAVHASLSATNFKEFVALAKAKPGTLSFASGGSQHHLTGELIKKLSGIDMIHVPYKGGGQAVIDLVGGQIPVGVIGSSPVIPHARTGKIRVLAVTSMTRSAVLPNVPTLAESGLTGFDVYQWISLLAPAKTPKEIITRLNSEVKKILTRSDVRERIEAAGFEARSSTPQEVEVLIREGQSRWGKLVKELGLKLN